VRIYDRDKGEICAKEGEGVFIVKEEERKGAKVYQRTIEKKVYQTLKITSNNISVFYRKEG